MVFSRLLSTTLVVSGLTEALAAPAETLNAFSSDAPSVLTSVPERTEGDRRRMDDGDLAYTWDLTPEQKQMFVDRHNYWRNQAALGELTDGKKAKQMPQMFWDDELAEHAKKFSRKCLWEHSMTVGWREIDYGYGENLYATSADGEFDDRYIQSSMDNWAYEHTVYNHDTLACSGVCGHYTAMVWEHTTRVGCAVAKCDSISGIGWSGHYVICQYYRGGNWGGRAPYEYSSSTGNGCSDGTYGESTGMDSTWPGLCNNQNDICTDTNRCSAMQTCESGSPLNGVDTEYTCGASECTYHEFPGYQIDSAYSYANGMSDAGGWKYFQSRQQCEDWCYLNKDASPGCKGCTQQSNQSPFLWFAVKTVEESERSAQTGLTLLVLDCSAPGPNPTPRPTESPVADPTSPPTDPPTDAPTSEPTEAPVDAPTSEPTEATVVDPTSPPAADPTSPPAADPTSPPTDQPTSEPTEAPVVDPTPAPTEAPVVSPTSPPAVDPTSPPTDDYVCNAVTHNNIEMNDACGADKVIVVDGAWKLCRETPDDCVEWCMANMDTYGCVGVSSDDRNPGFYFPVRSVVDSDRVTRAGAILITMDCAPSGTPTGPPVTPSPTMPPVTPEPTAEPTRTPTAESPANYECNAVTLNDVEMNDACAVGTKIVVDGAWQLCRDIPDDCIEWCKANRYTYGCMGVSSDDRNPGFYFPVAQVETSDRANRAGAILIVMDCTTDVNPTAPPANPTEQPTAEPTQVSTDEPTAQPTFEPTTAEPTAEPTIEPTSEPTADATSEVTSPYVCNTITIPNVQIRDVSPYKNGLTETGIADGSWAWCRDTPDECITWCTENRYTAPCLGVTSDAANPDFYFPVWTIAESERESVDGGSLIIMDCAIGGTYAPTSEPTMNPTVDASSTDVRFDVGTCEHLQVTDNGNCVETGGEYSNNVDCEITVIGDFVLDVRDFEVEAHSTCRYDYLELPNGDKFCIDSPNGLSVANGETLKWFTDSSVTKDGWKICASETRRREGEEERVLRRLQA